MRPGGRQDGVIMGQRRWTVIVGAVLIQLCLGSIYAWSVFTPALTDAGWSKTETQIVFSVALATFAVVMVMAGKRLETWGPRRLAMAGGVTLGAGYFLAGLGATSFWWVLICVGLIGGAGIGLAYVVPIAVGMRWYPDHKGFITGAAVAGFGFGALGWVKLAGGWGNLIDNHGLDTTFVIYGIAFAAMVTAGSTVMRMPPTGWVPEGFTPPPVAAGSGGEEFTPTEMRRTPQFHLISLTFAVSAGAGLMSIGLMKLYPIEALTANGITETEASAIAGTAMAVFFSLANGIGRLVWGTLSDRLGRKRSVVLMTASQGIFLLAFTYMAGNEFSLYLGAALIGFNFGGNFALFPALTADEFGDKSVAQNYPWVFLSFGAGGIVFPILGGWLGDLDNFPLAFSICGLACLIGAAASFLVFPPHQNEASRPFSVHGFLHNAHLFEHEEAEPV